MTNKTKSKNLSNHPRQSKYCAQTPLTAHGSGHDRDSTAATEWATDHDELHDSRAEREREGEGARLQAQLSGGGRVSVGGLQKRLGRMGAWLENTLS
jgi:hypothetical protein